MPAGDADHLPQTQTLKCLQRSRISSRIYLIFLVFRARSCAAPPRAPAAPAAMWRLRCATPYAGPGDEGDREGALVTLNAHRGRQVRHGPHHQRNPPPVRATGAASVPQLTPVGTPNARARARERESHSRAVLISKTCSLGLGAPAGPGTSSAAGDLP